MNGFNRVVLMGNLTRDPELRTLPSGTAVAEMGLAANESYKTREGAAGERVCFVEIVAWGRQAELCSQYLAKGAPVLVEGRLQYDRWETGDGHSRSKIKVRANSVQFLSSRRTGTELPAAMPGQAGEGEAQAPAPVKPDPAMAGEADAMPF